MARRVAAIAIFVLIAVSALAPIRSYDFFWHLATGRWIVDHHALPLYDPFALASAHIPWINGEWLYEVALYGAQAVAGLHGMSSINALFVAALFTVAFWAASRRRDIGTALLATAIGFAGAAPLLGVRPAAAAAFVLVGAVAVLDTDWSLRALTIAYAFVSIVWINTHPSALLAPILAATTLISDIRRWPLPLISAACLLINPFGWNAVIAPLRLQELVGSGEFVNAEWVASTPEQFPLFFATIAAVTILYVFKRPQRSDLWHIAIFAGLAILAVRHVRNQGLYFAPLPLLLPVIRLNRRGSVALAACAAIPIGFALYQADHRGGIDDERFPVRAVARLQSTGLSGNIYNVDQFGGYLEWMYYGRRCVLTDGRNELFRDFIALDARARTDSRVWHELLRRYQLDLAVEEYQAERVEVIDVATQERRYLPASLVRYRRRDWALITFDDAAMVFARRAAFPPALVERIEYRYLVPDDPAIGYLTPQIRAAARAEIARAKKEIGDLRVIRQLDEGARD